MGLPFGAVPRGSMRARQMAEYGGDKAPYVATPALVGPITAWSYSRWSDYKLCPLKAKFKHVDKLREPPNEAMTRGSHIHTLAEQYVRDGGERPAELDQFATEFTRLRRLRGIEVELKLALTSAWQPTGYFAPEAWLRVVVDLLHVARRQARVVDYKTGKVRPDNVTQLGLYALALFAVKPQLRRVDASLWYLDHGEVISRAYVPADVAELQAMWVRQTRGLLTDTTFKPTPNRLCSFCFYGKSGTAKGGPGLCKF